MFSAARRNLISRAAPSAARLSIARTFRPFSTAAVRLSDSGHEEKEIIQGPGPKPGRVPTNFELATGDERREYLATLEGKQYYDLDPLYLDKKGTRDDPTIVPSGADWRLVGCQGAPGEDHELLWIRVERSHGIDRCRECGNVFKLSDTGFDPNNLPPLPKEEH
ncbi:Cytochrome c oxidase subunit 4 [Coemansia guatemalensis]|uniref:Cytochrome c oxidase subunit 4 n=1 Tax=Coemansia guatemalensis TaxID=2761395 RepID=A0A9W8LV93_9FUNG|nr:Cytochrome c oxidase subunit 4 [Coemansia guatemalensis]